MAMEISSTAFGRAPIPTRHTCEGDDVSPSLHWQGVPAGAKSLVLVVDDPDAPDPRAPRMTWVHWVLANLPVDNGGQPDALPKGTVEGLNDWKRTGYGGPCPPIGRHRYFHKLYALDIVLDGPQAPDQGAGGDRDERSRAGARGTGGHVREDRTIELHNRVRSAAGWPGMSSATPRSVAPGSMHARIFKPCVAA